MKSPKCSLRERRWAHVAYVSAADGWTLPPPNLCTVLQGRAVHRYVQSAQTLINGRHLQLISALSLCAGQLWNTPVRAAAMLISRAHYSAVPVAHLHCFALFKSLHDCTIFIAWHEFASICSIHYVLLFPLMWNQMRQREEGKYLSDLNP